MSKENDLSYNHLHRQSKPFGNAAFDESAVNYEKFEARVTSVLMSLASGAVVAIDAPWGHGKTYFARNYVQRLKERDWSVLYIDAFEHDYIEDPFILIASALRSTISPVTHSNLIKAAVNVGKILLPLTARVAAKIATLGAIDNKDTDDFISAVANASSDLAEKVVQERIDAYESEHASVEQFRRLLGAYATEYAEGNEKPFVIFIDELDRCRPDFAVRLLERIKHLFDVENLIFVLMLDSKQLALAVKGVYGAEIDADNYLRKFIHLNMQLPARRSHGPGQASDLDGFMANLSARTKVGAQQASFISFSNAFKDFANAFDLSYREIERCYILIIVILRRQNVAPMFAEWLALVISLRIKWPEEYYGLLSRTDEASGFVGGIIQLLNAAEMNEHSVGHIRNFLQAHLGKDVEEQYVQGFRRMRYDAGVEVEDLLTGLANLIDMRAKE